MLHAIDVAGQNGNAAIHILSTDTDILILAIAYFLTLGANPCMLIVHGKSREFIVLKPIYDVLGCPLVIALIGFHSFTGCDTVGRFSGKGKITCWKSFKNFKGWQDHCSGIHWSLTGRHAILSSNISTLVRYICQLYLPVTSNEDPGSVRWLLFKKYQAKCEKIPPTKAALHEHILAEYGIWLTLRIQYLPHGRTNEEGCLCPVRTLLKPAPDAVIELIHCKWARYKCQKSMC